MKKVKVIMSPIIGGFIAFLTIGFLFYITGAFAQASFNIKEWSQDARNIVSLLGGMFAIIAFGVVFASIAQIMTKKDEKINKENNNDK
jgi:hypothetical protein